MGVGATCAANIGTVTKNGDPDHFSLRSIAVPAFGPSLLFGIGEGAILPIIPLTARAMGSSIAEASLIVALLGIGSLVSNIPASLLTARFGERRSMLVAAALSLGAMLVCVFAPVLWVLAVGVFLVGAAAAVFSLARQSYLTEAVPPIMRARAMSTLGGVARIGIFIGPFVGALVIHLAGLPGAYWVAAVAVTAAGAVAWQLPDLAPRGGSGPVGTKPTIAGLMATHRKVFLSVGMGVLLVSAVRSSRQVVVPLWAESLGLSPATTSLIYGLSGAVDMLIFYPAGKIMDLKGRTAVAIPSMVLMGLGLLLMPLSNSATTLLLVALLIGFGNGLSSGLIMTLGADHAPPNGRAQFLGIWRFMSAAGGSSGPAILAFLTAAVTLSFGIAAAGVLGLAAAAVLGYSVPRNPPPRR